MYKILFYLFFLAVLLVPAGTASAILPDGWSSQDIGTPGIAGSADQAANVWTVSGSGHDIWDDADDFHFCYRQYSGDVTISAKVVSITGGSHEWTKAGVMIRESLNDTSTHSIMAMTNNTGITHATSFQGRVTTGGASENTDNQPAGYALGDPIWVEIQRTGSTLTGRISLDGVNYTLISTRSITMADPVYIGLAVTSHDDAQIMTGTFEEVKVNGVLAGQCSAYNPDPPTGSYVPPEYYPPNVYMLLDYTPGSCTAGYYSEGFFSTDKSLVDAMDPSVSLGTVPPWPLSDPEAWVVGYDDPGIPAFARVPLVPGTTYYWSVASFDGTDWWPSNTWSFTPIPEQAWGPYPADGETLIPADVTATWHLGDLVTAGKTLTYNVYIGTDETAVENVATGDTVSPLYAGNVSAATINLAGLPPLTEQFWRVDTSLAISRPPFTKTFTKGDVWSFTTGPRGIGGILREWWIGMSGTAIIDLTNDPNYPANPDGSEIVNIFEGPTNWQDDEHPYGSRLHGWLYVETTGDYTFWIATDDNGEFWISTDMSPANASLVSQCTAWAPARAFDDPEVIPSGPIHLEGGNMYYVMGLMKEQGGGDNIAVAWQGPDSDDVREVIPGKHLVPYSPIIADNPNPPHLSLDAPLNVTLTWTGGEDQATGLPYATQRVYVGSDPAAVAAATTSSPEYKGTVSVDQYGPLSLSYYQQVYWRIDGVNGDGVVNFQGAVWTFKATYNPANIVDTNLRLWLKFEDNALDSSGYGRHGTEVGGPIYVDGEDGRAIRLDGIDDYVNVEDHVGISGAAPRTIAGWGKATNTVIPDWTDLFGFTGPSGNGGHFDIEIVGGTDSTTAGWFGLHMYGDEYDIIPADIEWHHFAATFDGASAALYADGVSVNVVAPGITINTSGNVHVGKRDDNANYFPGSIDDVRIYDVVKTEAEIAAIMRINLAWAWNPDPRHGAISVPRDQDLSWNHGDGRTMSTVYFGADDASNMALVAGPQASTTYNPGILDLGTTYFWQIAESPDAPGRLWKFTTSEYLVVDDMEAYMPWTDPIGPWVFVSWRDGFGDCTEGSGNDSGAVLTEDATVLLTGAQSMKYEFDNDGTVYSPCTLGQVGGRDMWSKIEAQVAGLPSGIGSDWTAGGVKALSINFMGQAGNSMTDPFWVQLQDSSKSYGTKVFYGYQEGEDMADFNEPTWHEWLIDLADFDVDLTNVVSCVIGIGTEGSASPGGSGTIWIDDIRLYVPRCVPQRAKPAADFDGSCKVDFPDAVVLFDAWLAQMLPEDVWAKAAWTSTDIGDVNVPGSFTDFGGGSYSITGRGADIWGTADAFHYAFKPLSGDGQMTVRVTDITGPSANDWRKAGIMIRETLDPNSPHAFMAVTPVGGGGSSFQWRPSQGSASLNQDGPAGVTMPQCIRLTRAGDVFTAFRYANGEWVKHGNSIVVPMAEDVMIGLAACSHEVTLSTTATFDRTCSTEFLPIDVVEDDLINFEDYAELLNLFGEEVLWPTW